MESIIEIKGLSKDYGKTKALDNIALTVSSGDFYGFIGPNGAGKSTAIRILLGLTQATSGEAMVLGKTIGPSPTEILSRVGYVPSESQFYPGMTAHEIIKLSAKIHGGVDSQETERLTRLFQVQLNQKVDQLSFGNRRKLSLVMALHHRPELIIMDEPTSGLDPLMQQYFWNEIQERNRQGVTIFTSSHNLSEIQKYCRHAAVIRQGQIIQEGAIKDLMDSTAKRVSIQGLSQLPDLEGELRDVIQDEDSISFLYQGEVAQLLDTLGQSSQAIHDIEISNPDLEEVFMHFYDNEEGGE